MDLFDPSIQIMQKAMDLRMVNQQIIASNIANVDTPGYTARRLDFETSLQNAIDQIEQEPIIEESTDPAISLDGNNVDMETELAQLGRNKTMYRVTAQLMAAKMQQLTTIIEQEP